MRMPEQAVAGRFQCLWCRQNFRSAKFRLEHEQEKHPKETQKEIADYRGG